MRQPDSSDMATVSHDYEGMFGSPIAKDRQEDIIDMLDQCDSLDDVETLADSEQDDDHGLSAGEADTLINMLEARCGWTWRHRFER